ncbi:MAG: MATE family efflux transporter [Planctomycetota bacterium]|nr:MATE family efflux transporter [Planctomycetota bacterium]
MRKFRSRIRRRILTLGDWRGLSGTFTPRPDEMAPGLRADGTLKTGRLAGMGMGTAIWVLCWPILIESFLNSFVGLVDTMLSAQLGVPETDAVGSAAYILWFMGLIMMAISVGTTALVSRSIGRGRLAVANAAVGQSLLLAVTLGTIVAVVFAGVAPHIAGALTKSQAGADAFTAYLQIVAAGTPFMAVLMAGIASLRGAGDSIRPLWAMVIVNVVNIVISWSLCGEDLSRLVTHDGVGTTEVLLRNPFPFDLGVLGIAWGTVIANAVGCLIVLGLLVRGAGGVQLRRRRLRAHWHTMRRLVRVGLPNFFETFGMWVGNFLVFAFVINLSQTDGIAGAHMLAIRIEAFSFMPGFAMSLAAATLAGQYLGAGSPRMARLAVVWCAMIAAVVMGSLGIMFITIPEQLVALLSSQPEHMEVVPGVLRIAGLVQVPFALAIVVRGALRGVGDMKVVFVITWATTYLLRLPLAYVFSGVDMPLPDGTVLENPFRDEPSLRWLWVGLSIELLLRGVLFVSRFVQGGWTKSRV